MKIIKAGRQYTFTDVLQGDLRVQGIIMPDSDINIFISMYDNLDNTVGTMHYCQSQNKNISTSYNVKNTLKDKFLQFSRSYVQEILQNLPLIINTN